MELGIIRSIKKDRGFGFIRRNKINGQKMPDVFFHAAECDNKFDEWSVGLHVSFEITRNQKGEEASNVAIHIIA